MHSRACWLLDILSTQTSKKLALHASFVLINYNWKRSYASGLSCHASGHVGACARGGFSREMLSHVI